MAHTHDDIVTLTANDGEEIDFLNIAGINYRGNYYAILQPVKLLDGMSDDEALVFKVIHNPSGNDNYNIELDDKIIDGVFAEYNRLLDSSKGGKKLKKSGGMKKIFGTTTKIAKGVVKTIFGIIGGVTALLGIILVIVGFTEAGGFIENLGMIIPGAIMFLIGAAILAKVVKSLKKRK